METEKKPISEKKLTSEALKRAKKKYCEKMKFNEDFMNKNKEAVKEWHNKHKNEESYKQMTRKNSKKYYENNREKVLERMRNYNANKKENCSINILLPNIVE